MIIFFKASFKILSNKKYDILYSNIIYKKNTTQLQRKYKTGIISNQLKLGWHLPHPGSIINKNLLKNMNYFNTNYKISADFDFFLNVCSIKMFLTFTTINTLYSCYQEVEVQA